MVRPAAPAVIEVEHVTQTFTSPSGSRFHAVEDVSFSVHDGEFVSLIGPSGCGKSTLLRILADVMAPSAGSVRVRGKTPRQARLDRDYGFVFQRPVLFDWRSVLRNVRLPFEVVGAPRDAAARRAEELLGLGGLAAFARHAPWQLSGGMQQRVAIARALATRPSILYLDEPFGALDEITRDAMNAELLKICAAAGATALLVTHSIPEAVLLSDRVLVMGTGPGRIIATVDVGLGQPRTPAVVRDSDAFFHKVIEVRRALHAA